MKRYGLDCLQHRDANPKYVPHSALPTRNNLQRKHVTHFAYRTERYAKKHRLSPRYANRPRSLASEVARSRTGRAAGPARPRSLASAPLANGGSAAAPVPTPLARARAPRALVWRPRSGEIPVEMNQVQGPLINSACSFRSAPCCASAASPLQREEIHSIGRPTQG